MSAGLIEWIKQRFVTQQTESLIRLREGHIHTKLDKSAVAKFDEAFMSHPRFCFFYCSAVPRTPINWLNKDFFRRNSWSNWIHAESFDFCASRDSEVFRSTCKKIFRFISSRSRWLWKKKAKLFFNCSLAFDGKRKLFRLMLLIFFCHLTFFCARPGRCWGNRNKKNALRRLIQSVQTDG